MADALSNKTALITGGRHRIGRSIVLALAAEKVHCVIQCRPENGTSAEEVLKEIRTEGVDAHVVKADFSKPGGAEKIFPELERKNIRIDCLINNASVFEESRLFDLDRERMISTLSINAFSPLILARHFAGQTRTGAIVNILDTRIAGYDMQHAGYVLSKTMLYQLTQMMALECAPGIRVNAVAPGLILPPNGKGYSHLKRNRLRTLLHKHGNTKNITDAVIFLLKNDFMTGETLFVDGGEHLRWKRDGGNIR